MNTENKYIDLDAAFDRINDAVFNGCIRKEAVTLRWSSKIDAWGICRIMYKKKRNSNHLTDVRYEITLSDTQRDSMSHLNTLCHEMCHLWMYQHGYIKHGHNLQWKAIADYCNDFGFNVTVRSKKINNVHEETDVYNVYSFDGYNLKEN